MKNEKVDIFIANVNAFIKENELNPSNYEEMKEISIELFEDILVQLDLLLKSLNIQLTEANSFTELHNLFPYEKCKMYPWLDTVSTYYEFKPAPDKVVAGKAKMHLKKSTIWVLGQSSEKPNELAIATHFPKDLFELMFVAFEYKVGKRLTLEEYKFYFKHYFGEVGIIHDSEMRESVTDELYLQHENVSNMIYSTYIDAVRSRYRLHGKRVWNAPKVQKLLNMN